MDILLFFFLGASLASFIGVVVERFPEKSLITPASHCQACGTTLPAWDLIPILSFLINRGRCRFCQVKLPIWYLLIECFLGIVSVGYYHHILSGQICMTILLSVLLSLYDLKSLGFPILA
ncbi:prepilin peptidase [Streptococcus alactolyticus]